MRLVPLVAALAAGCSERRAPAAVAAATDPATPTAAVARVTAFSGDVRIRRNSVGEWLPLAANAAISPDDMVQALGTGVASLRAVATGAEIIVQPNTTIRFDGTRPHAMSGRVVAKIGDANLPTRLELSLPPGVLVLTTDPKTHPNAEATIDVADDRSAVIEMRLGAGRLVPVEGEPIVVDEHRRLHVDPRGHIVDQASDGAVVELVEPRDGARLRVRRDVTLRWTPSAGADGYRISIDSGALARQLDVTTASADVPIASGRYRWTVQALHAGRAAPIATRRTFEVEVDNRPPELSITNPIAGAVVTGPRLRIDGRSKPGAAITVARSRTIADANGRFALDVSISRGLSNLVILARDDLGNQQRVSRSVVWE